MFSRHLLFPRNIRCLSETLNVCRRFHKFSRQVPTSIICKQQVKPIFFRNVRYATTNSGLKKNVPLIVGLATVGGAVVAYTVFRKKKSSTSVAEDEDVEIPFVQEHLKEDLALLDEFGAIPYLLIGAGAASFSAYRAIRTRDPTAKVLMIGDEEFFPYMRPPLSKEMWYDDKPDITETLSFAQWDGKNRSVFFESPSFYFSMKELLDNKNGGISVIRGKKRSRPKNLPVFENVDKSIKKHITLFKTIKDFRKLDKVCKKSESVIIVGGGFLGSELACGLTRKYSPSSLQVSQIFPETGNIGKVLPEYLSTWTTKKLESEGVKIIPEVEVKAMSKQGNKIEMLLSNNQVVKADHIVVAVGADPNTDFAKISGLEIDPQHGGFVVNTEMEARKNLWIAGDASCFYDANLGRRRVEHYDHANVSGRLAGENMAGNNKPYWHQSMFWSDLGPQIGFEGIGVVDSSLPTVGVFIKPKEIEKPEIQTDVVKGEEKSDVSKSETKLDSTFRSPNSSDDYAKGLIFYIREDTIVGILLWNVLGKMQIARQVINEAKSQDDVAEIAKLFELHDSEEVIA
ncbi:apoptosis-inducing factor 1, mitochondrial [Caerostris extrusa]|uniref:Apoptosis-inducing factor 1, mitochondrial n=1 Tax=Caerostris extrusa TaxID=172846 RepID=A0AAV4XLL8_CAEEX|nr:apoptosis-inducing factor 1, mitochondrial [Caerostris extrusa]